MFTKNISNGMAIYLAVILFLLGFIAGTVGGEIYLHNHPPLVTSEQWSRAIPMKIYTIIDKDTGVYYAVTEKGGICVMETMSGETKLVDQGDGTVIHKNQG